ncbi:MAG: DUF4331 domain-containing protein [Candidatus Limnocylindria bacterium]
MSSHREAPEISKDPVADNTDVYAFVDPNDSTKVTLIANYIPFEEPAGGPNFFQFGDDVLYEINIDNDGDARADIVYQFRFTTRITNPATFLYNTGPITSLTTPSWNLRQTYSVTRIAVGHNDEDDDEERERRVLGADLASPPVRIGPRSTPDYAALANAAIHSLPNGVKVFAGQRDEGFFVDVGSIFDLGALRPFQNLHLIPLPAMVGTDGTKGFNVHSIALQVPKTELTRGNSTPLNVMDPKSVIGVWATASRQRGKMRGDDGGSSSAGSWVQVSRLGNPLINEVIIPMARKDGWNGREPRRDADFLAYYRDPELQNLLPVLYPGVFPNLAALLTQPAESRSRDDLVAILATGIPNGVISGFQNFTGPRVADMLRLNLAIPPASTPSPFGLLGGDTAGFPNGRRVADNVVAIELRAVAGVTLPLVRPSFTADGAASLLTDGTANEQPYLSTFPYLAHPHEGYEHSHD